MSLQKKNPDRNDIRQAISVHIENTTICLHILCLDYNRLLDSGVDHYFVLNWIELYSTSRIQCMSDVPL